LFLPNVKLQNPIELLNFEKKNPN